jgi:hypothetical protein
MIDQQIIPNAENKHGIIDFRDLFNTTKLSACIDCTTYFEYDDLVENKITLTHFDAKGSRFKNEFTLPEGITYKSVIEKIRHLFEKN